MFLYLFVYTAIKNIIILSIPPTPKGVCFCFYFSVDKGNPRPVNNFISVIDNVCYVYPRARALCEKKGV